ncbi:MAG: DNA alkylation repair protein [Pseudomonadota bacterium]|nr:DNA alkylation repair protein [Pseudomonadota bacterium]
MMSILAQLTAELQHRADPKYQAIQQRFFKTAAGDYGAGDIFLGVKVPLLRAMTQKYRSLSLEDIETLLHSSIHEYRFLALLFLIQHYRNTASDNKAKLFNFYLHHSAYVNNWDLVDVSAPAIIGHYVLDKPKTILYTLSRSPVLWQRRMAIVATFTLIKNHQLDETLYLAEQLLNDSHPLIHKAVGWMLREVGKRDQPLEETFLRSHHRRMPRVMLRYSIEKFDTKRRKIYLKR